LFLRRRAGPIATLRSAVAMVCLIERGERCGPKGGKRYDEPMGRTLQATFSRKPNLPVFSRQSLSTV